MILIKRRNEKVHPLRRLLIQALTLGAPAALASGATAQGVFGSRPARLPPNQSVYSLRGTAKVNDVDASIQTQIRSGDTIETGKDSELVFVVGGNSMILRSDSRLVLSGPPQRTDASSLIVTGLRLLTGKVLSVSRNQPMRVGPVADQNAASTFGSHALALRINGTACVRRALSVSRMLFFASTCTGGSAMSDLMLGLGQMLAVVVIVGGVSIALWQVWVLANKLCRIRDEDAPAAPAESHMHIARRRGTQSKIELDSDSRMWRRPDAR